MTDVFISYARVDAERADRVAAALQSAGIAIWIDRRGIEEGRAYDRQIESALVEARFVVVLWSARSVESDWVRNEAAEAYRLGKLVPVLMDDVPPPLQLRNVHAIDLRGWSGDGDAPEMAKLVASIHRRLQSEDTAVHETAASAPAPSRLRHLVQAAGIAFADAALERRFARYFDDRYMLQVRMYLLFGAMLFAVYAVVDFLLGRSTPISSVVEFILLPNIVAGFLLTLWAPIRKVWRLFIILASLGSLALIVLSLHRAALMTQQESPAYLVYAFLIGTFVFLGLIPTRFLDSLVICTFVLAATLQYPWVAGTAQTVRFEDVETVISIFTCLIVSGWWREQQARRWFLENNGLTASLANPPTE